MIQVGYAVVWWQLLVFIGLITFPLMSRVCSRLPDRGYSISKIFGLLFVTYLSWLLSSTHIVKFGYINIAISILLVIAVSFFLGRKHLNLKNLPWRSIAVSEAVFTLAFVLFLVYLRQAPDINYIHSEDFMDFAFLQAVIRTDYFPPTDPWLAGYSIPYYYGGHALSAVLTMISRVPSGIAYNLAIATFVALAVNASYGLGYSVTRRKLYGFVTVLFVCVVGFFSGAFQLAAFISQQDVMGYSPTNATDVLDWFSVNNFVASNWLIEGAALDNPFYAFMNGHLRADMLDIPFQLMIITLVFALFRRDESNDVVSKTDSLLVLCVLGLTLGAMAFINTWAYPVYLLFTLLAFLLFKIRISKKGILGIIALSILLYLPYHLSRGDGGIGSVGLVEGRTELIEFVAIFALFIFAIISYFFILAGRRPVQERVLVLAVILIGITALLSFLWGPQLIVLLIPLILASAYYIHRARPKKETEFILLLVLTGAIVALLCEIVFIDDPLGGLFERFNTLAKFYLHIWVLFAVSSAFAVYWVLKNAGGKVRAAWLVVLALLIVGSLIRPVGLIANYASDRHPYFGHNRGTLDGLEYVKTISPGDYEALKWISGNIVGNPVILEAPGVGYTYSSRISALTGLPTVIGWINTHEVMWRGGWDEVAGRDTDVDTIYQTVDEAEAGVLLEKYNVEYIYVGTVEKERYEEWGLEKFAASPGRYELVFESQGARVYRVVGKN